uniref:tRNA aspartic acid methyltransferase 1 n=1 Tax=Molossus molossus TaxID=27622 RepID=A0A7J8K351_MOLMO|nr:tRNA aspartic acid methyltransferase 1 [Molossus molossus]
MEPLRVLELYSGIGGMHQALRESCVPAHVVAAIDVNHVANEVYKYNFPHTQLLAKTIEVLMEFPQIESEHPQKYAVDAENKIEGKKIEPNVCFDSSRQCSGKEAILFKLETAEEIDRKHQQDSDLSVQMLKDFLEDDADMNQYFLPPKPLLRYALLLDIVKPTCRRSMCFTKGYGRYIEGTGSVLQTTEDVQVEDIYKSLTSLSQEEKITKLLMLKLRYFTPKEIANLLGFPPEFGMWGTHRPHLSFIKDSKIH